MHGMSLIMRDLDAAYAFKVLEIRFMFLQKIQTPSLHIFDGSAENDRQVDTRESELLAERFENAHVIRHGQGHMIPCGKTFINRIACFLESQMSTT